MWFCFHRFISLGYQVWIVEIIKCNYFIFIHQCIGSFLKFPLYLISFFLDFMFLSFLIIFSFLLQSTYPPLHNTHTCVLCRIHVLCRIWNMMAYCWHWSLPFSFCVIVLFGDPWYWSWVLQQWVYTAWVLLFFSHPVTLRTHTPVWARM